MKVCISCKESSNNFILFTCSHYLCSQCLHKANKFPTSFSDSTKKSKYSCICGLGEITLSFMDNILTCLKTNTVNQDNRCINHDEEFIFPKNSIGMPLCTKCIYDNQEDILKNEHNKASLDEKINKLKIQSNEIYNNLSKLETKYFKLFHNLISNISKLRYKIIEQIKLQKETITQKFLDDIKINKTEYDTFLDQPYNIDTITKEYNSLKKYIIIFEEDIKNCQIVLNENEKITFNDNNLISSKKQHKTLNISEDESITNYLINETSIKSDQSDNCSIKESYNQEKSLLIPNNNSICVFDQSLSQTRQLDGHSWYVICLTKLSNNLIASGGCDNTIIIWDYSTGKSIRILKGHTGRVFALTKLQNGFLVSGSFDKTIRIWNEEYTCVKLLSEGSYSILSLLTIHNGLLVAGLWDKLLKVFDPFDDYKCKYTLEGHNGPVYCIKQLPNTDLVSLSWDAEGTIIIWNNFKRLKEWKTGSNGRSLCILSNIHIATGHEDKKIRIWDLQTLECLSELDGHTNYVRALILSNGRLITASFNEVIIWQQINDRNIFKKHNRIIVKGGFNTMLEM